MAAPHGWTVMLASDVHDRDGLSLELRDPSGAVVAEVFRDDTDATRRFTCDGVSIDPDVLSWFLDTARTEL